MAEIDDTELATLRTAAAFIEKVEQLDGGRGQIEGWAKKINPKIKTSADVADEYAKPFKEELGALRAWKNGMEKKISDYDFQEKINGVKDEYGFTDEGVDSLKKFMTDNNIKDPVIGAAAYDRLNPSQPTRSSYMSDEYTLGELAGNLENKEAELTKILRSPDRYRDDQIREFYSEKAKKSVKWGG